MLLSCPLCDSIDFRDVLYFPEVPVFCNVLYDTAERALAAPTGDIALVACQRCGMVFNTAFDESLVVYEGSYENSLHFSPTFRAYADELADYLAARYQLEGGLVVEIGCGKGEFLERLCEVAGCRGLGFDPAFGGEVEHPDIEIVAEEFPTDLDSTPDLVVFRQVLEHLSQPSAFLGAIQGATGGHHDTAIYCEVPSGEFVLGTPSLWDIIYEHVGYFTEETLRNIFAQAGFSTERVFHAFRGQFLAIEAWSEHAASGGESVQEQHSPRLGLGDAYGTAASRTLEEWSSRVAAWRDDGARVAIWGMGSKGVTFMNLVEGAGRAIEILVDINPRKQGKYAPRVGNLIGSPRVLEKNLPDKVLVMNPIYEQEIREAMSATSSEIGQPMPQVVLAVEDYARSVGESPFAGPKW